MRWGRRSAPGPPREDPAAAPEPAVPPPLERASPGLAALFTGLGEDPRHTVLDLGPAIAANLLVYSRFARRLWIADLLPHPPPGDGWRPALDHLRIPPDRLPDLVLAWDLLPRLPAEQRPLLVRRLAELTPRGARMYLVVDGSGRPSPPFIFSLLGLDRVAQQAVGPATIDRAGLAPAEVDRLLAPFRVVHSFVLREGLREYVAVRD